MNPVLIDQARRANGHGEPARNRTNGASQAEREGGEASPRDPMAETAECLVRIATKAFMQMRNVDYETAQRWIAGAAVPEASSQPAPKSRRTRR